MAVLHQLLLRLTQDQGMRCFALCSANSWRSLMQFQSIVDVLILLPHPWWLATPGNAPFPLFPRHPVALGNA